MNDSWRALGPDSERGSQPAGAVASSPRPTRIAIRVWTPKRVELGWASESTLIYMISDLISASGGLQVGDAGAGMVAQFEYPSLAFRTAKRIQWSLLEFCQHRSEQCLGAAIVIYDSRDFPSESGGSSSLEICALLECLEPAQILVSASAGKQLQEIPGFQLRAFPPAQHGSSSWQRGVQELVWTSQANFEHVQQTLKNVGQAWKGEKNSASAPTIDLNGFGPRAAQPTLLRGEPPPPVLNGDRDNLLSELVDPKPDTRGFGPRALWWSLAAVGALAVVVFMILLPRLHRKAVVLESTPVIQPTPTSETSTVKVETPPQPEPSNDNAQVSPPKPVDDLRTPSRIKAPEQSTHAQSKKVVEYEGMTEKDIPFLIRKAEADAGAGRYEDARREFDIVLRLDPSSSQAKDGLRKLNLSEQETR
jgi:hypothetical protein